MTWNYSINCLLFFQVQDACVCVKEMCVWNISIDFWKDQSHCTTIMFKFARQVLHQLNSQCQTWQVKLFPINRFTIQWNVKDLSYCGKCAFKWHGRICFKLHSSPLVHGSNCEQCMCHRDWQWVQWTVLDLQFGVCDKQQWMTNKSLNLNLATLAGHVYGISSLPWKLYTNYAGSLMDF